MWGSEQSTSLPGQFSASFRLPGVSVDTVCGDVLSESVQLGFEVSDLLLEISKFLRASMSLSVVCGGDQLDWQYLVMLDERAHSTEGGLEGREPIGGLIRNIEEDLGAIGDSLPLCWETRRVRELA